jgi:cytochrome c
MRQGKAQIPAAARISLLPCASCNARRNKGTFRIGNFRANCGESSQEETEMRVTAKTITAVTLALALAACGSPSEEKPADPGGTTPVAPAAADARPAAFAQCAACHSVEPGKNGVGPSLAGVFGSKAGSVAGYNYTPANKNSGLTWDEATLDTYLTAPMKTIPGTKMSFGGMSDAAQRKAIIEYMKTLK